MKIKERMVGDVAILDVSGKLMGGPPGSDEFRDAIYGFIDMLHIFSYIRGKIRNRAFVKEKVITAWQITHQLLEE